MSANPVLWDLDQRGVATVTLNRPEVNNAYDAGLINGVLAAMDELGRKPNLRVVVLKGNGKHFQAGADLKWINGVRPKSPAENEVVSRATFEAVQRLNTLPIPTVALVQGGCFGGGTGVISACDVVIAAVSPQRTSVIEKIALSAAITTSQAEMTPVPPPKQPPCTSATVGIGKRFNRCTASKVARETAPFSAGDFGRTPLIHFRSAPA